MRKAAVDYVSACHKHNVEASQALIDAESKGMCLSVDLQSYASEVIKDAGHTDGNLWNAYINVVVSALGAELSSICFDVAALVLAERQEKAAKQATLTAAAADAEMMDSTQPIDSIIKEHVESAGTSHAYSHTSLSQVLPLLSSSLHPCSVQTTQQASGRDRQRVEKEETKEEQTESGTLTIQRPECFGVVFESCNIVPERHSVEEKGKGVCGKRKRKRKRKEKRVARAGENEGESEVKEVETLGAKRLRVGASYTPPSTPHLVTTWAPPPGVMFHRLKPDTYPPVFFSAPLVLQS